MGSPITIFFVGYIASHTRSSASTSTLTLVVARERVPSSKTASTFRANVRPLSGMEFGVSFQIMESPEARLAGLTDIRLFLAVREQVALEVMMPCKLSGAVRTAVLLGSRGALTPVETGIWQAESAARIAEISGRHRIGEGLVACFFSNSCFVPMTRAVPILGGRILNGPGTGYCSWGVQEGGSVVVICGCPVGIIGCCMRIDLHMIGGQGHGITDRVGL